MYRLRSARTATARLNQAAYIDYQQHNHHESSVRQMENVQVQESMIADDFDPMDISYDDGSVQDDINTFAVSSSNEFLVNDQQLVLLHSYLKSSIASKHFFDVLSTVELVQNCVLPLHDYSATHLKKELKKLWNLQEKFYCSHCLGSLKFETSKCKEDGCRQKEKKKNVIVCTAGAQQQLLNISKKYYDFSGANDGDDVFIQLTINTDGFIPKGHSKREFWPVFLQIANIDPRFKCMHDSVAFLAVVVAEGKPSDFAWEKALYDLIFWLRNQSDGLKLKISGDKIVKLFFEISNLSCDLAAGCHLFCFATWASSEESCFKCLVKPIYEHRGQRFDIVGPFVRRTNLNITLDMLHHTRGFKGGATFWMNLVNILNYRFDTLHKICEGVCSNILREMFGTIGAKLPELLRYKKKQNLYSAINKINWPQKCKIVFSELNSGCATEKLGAFLIGVPMTLLESNMNYETALWLIGLVAVISYVFCEQGQNVAGMKLLLNDLAKLQIKLCGTKLSTLKFHYFFGHLFDDEDDTTYQCSTFVFEAMNCGIKLRYDAHHTKGFASVVLEKYLLERLVKLELTRRAEFCPEVKSYLSKTNWKKKRGIAVGDYLLKTVIDKEEARTNYSRVVWKSCYYCIFDDNETHSHVVFKNNDSLCFGDITKISEESGVVTATVVVHPTMNIMDCLENLNHHSDVETVRLGQNIIGRVSSIISRHVGIECIGNSRTVEIPFEFIIGHCVIAKYQGYTYYFNVSLKPECK